MGKKSVLKGKERLAKEKQIKKLFLAAVYLFSKYKNIMKDTTKCLDLSDYREKVKEKTQTDKPLY